MDEGRRIPGSNTQGRGMNAYDFHWKYIERPRRILHSFFFRTLLGWDNAILIQREANKARNELVYDSPFNVVRLLGWTDQYEEDYYWVIQTRRDGVQLYTCVGGFSRLKNRLSRWEYLYADWCFEVNEPIATAFEEIKKRGIVLK